MILQESLLDTEFMSPDAEGGKRIVLARPAVKIMSCRTRGHRGKLDGNRFAEDSEEDGPSVIVIIYPSTQL